MAVRTVSVELKMKISDFELAAAKAAATTKALAGEFDDLGKTSGKFSTAKPTKEMQNFARVINGALKDGKTGFASIQTAIDDTKTHIAKLRQEIHTGSGSDSIFGDLRQANKDLRTLQRVMKDLGGDAEQAAKAGRNAAQGFFAGFSRATPIFANPVGGAIVGVAAPIIIAGLSAAVTTGVGLGLIGAAALIQKDNPRIVAAVTDLRNDAVGVFRNATEPLVEPFVEALGYADQLLLREGPALRGMFSAVAPAVQLIAHGLGTLASDIIPVVTRGAQNFTAALKDPQVHAVLQSTEQAVVGLFKVFTDDPRLAKDGLIVLSGTVEALAITIELATAAVADFADALHFVLDVGDSIQSHVPKWLSALSPFLVLSGLAGDQSKKLADVQRDVQQSIDAATAAAQHAAPTYQQLSQQIGQVTLTSSRLQGQLTDKMLNTLMSLDQATLGWHQSLTSLGDTIDGFTSRQKKTAGSLDLTKKSAQDLEQQLLAVIGSNQQTYDSMINAGAGSDVATKAYDANTKSLEDQLKKQGLLTPAVQKLIDKYGDVPDTVSTAVAVQGLTDAIDNLNSTLLLLSHIDGFAATATVTTVYRTKGRPATGPLAQNFSRWGGVYENRWGGVYQPAADGLLTHAQVYTPVNPGRFMIAEPATRGEAFIPKNGEYGRSMSILAAAAGWYGAHVVEGRGSGRGGGPVTLVVTGGDAAGAAFVQTMRFAIQQRGGDVVKVLTPR